MGFPCQDLSQVGTCKGISGKSSSLVWAALALLRKRPPRSVLIENVPFMLRLERAADRLERACSGRPGPGEIATLSAPRAASSSHESSSLRQDHRLAVVDLAQQMERLKVQES